MMVYLFQDMTIVMPQGADPVAGVDTRAADASFRGTESLVVCDVPPPGRAPGDAGSVRGVLLPHGLALPAGWTAAPVRAFVPVLTDGVLLRAYHVTRWRQESAYCGSCGARNGDSALELARLCPACGRVEYPRIAPATITLIENEAGEALLAHNRNFTKGVYSLIAGFVEAGESLEDCVAREAREEVSLDVSGIRYATSQPWPFPNSLMVGFRARYAGGEIRPDGTEIEDAHWFPRDKLPLLPGRSSIARRLIDQWLGERCLQGPTAAAPF